jgi:hypothetical protein
MTLKTGNLLNLQKLKLYIVLSAKTLPKEDIKLDELILGFANLGGIIL